MCKTAFNKTHHNAHSGFINCTKNPIELIRFNDRLVDMNKETMTSRDFTATFKTVGRYFIITIDFYPPKDQLFLFNYYFQNKYWHETNVQGVFSMMQTSKINS